MIRNSQKIIKKSLNLKSDSTTAGGACRVLTLSLALHLSRVPGPEPDPPIRSQPRCAAAHPHRSRLGPIPER